MEMFLQNLDVYLSLHSVTTQMKNIDIFYSYSTFQIFYKEGKRSIMFAHMHIFTLLLIL
jgi:hypothetical protein